MEYWEAIVLGIVQGLTEFLPVSSSGHLELGKAILGDQSIPEESLLFTVVLHFATALSTVVVFRKDVANILADVFRFKRTENSTLALKILISMLPAIAVGLFYEEQLERFFNGNILLVGLMLLVTAILLILADRAKLTGRSVSYSNAFVIGIAQAIAMLPGISRSGATISTSVLLGNDKNKAARFSFLMVVPLIFGKIAKDLLSGDLSTQNADMAPFAIGFVAAFVSGLMACTWMIRLVRKAKLKWFAYYCIAVGIIAIVVSLQ